MKNGTFYSLGAKYLSHYGRKGMKWGKNIFEDPAANAYNQGKRAENMQRNVNNGSAVLNFKRTPYVANRSTLAATRSTQGVNNHVNQVKSLRSEVVTMPSKPSTSLPSIRPENQPKKLSNTTFVDRAKQAENMQRGLNNGTVMSTYKGPNTMAVHTPTKNEKLNRWDVAKKRYGQQELEGEEFYKQVYAENPERAKRMREEYNRRAQLIVDKKTKTVAKDANKAEIKRINELAEQLFGYRMKLIPGKVPEIGEKVGTWTAITKK